MKFLKKFNENINTDEIKKDIHGLLVELEDIGLTINIQINSQKILVGVYYPRIAGQVHKFFRTSDIYEYIMTLVAYIKSKFNNINDIEYRCETLKILTNLVNGKVYNINKNPLPNNTIEVSNFIIKFDLDVFQNIFRDKWSVY